MEMVTSISAIVPEVLKEDNYERWSILMKYYLVAHDLWDVVQSSNRQENDREWMKKNALALHAIGISCERKAFDHIRNINSAQGAWDTLAAKLKPTRFVQDVAPDISEPHQGRQTGHEEELRKLVCHGSIYDVKRFLRELPDADSPPMLDFALKRAITCGRKNMARDLYREHPLNLSQEDSGFVLLEHCITKRMFDIALDLLCHFQGLASELPANRNPIILTLAQTAPPFLSLNELGYWGHWIYKSTRVKAFPIKPRSAPVGGVNIVQDKLSKWILPMLYKFHLICVMIGLLCWVPCWLLPVRMSFVTELLLLFLVPLLKLDLLCVLIGVPLYWFLVPLDERLLALKLFPVFILLLGKQ